jgi:hypothetical protein
VLLTGIHWGRSGNRAYFSTIDLIENNKSELGPLDMIP